MADRDPFPMRSEEAKRLAASVDTGTQDDAVNWDKMGTGTEVAAPMAYSGEAEEPEGGAGDALTGLKKGVQKGGSIYEQAELDEHQGQGRHHEDEFLDMPLRGRGDTDASMFFPPWVRRNTLRLHKRLYGDLPPSEIWRTLCLASTLFFLIGGYWSLRSLKDPVLTALCGVTVIPKAKMLSVFIVLGVVSIYNKLLDQPNLPRHKLFYLFGTFYFLLFAAISVLLAHPTIGLANQVPDPARVLGWISYCSIESFGSVMVSLFWSFANSNFKLETAKASYGLLVATAQLGSILGPTLVKQFATSWGVPGCYFMGASCMVFLQLTLWLYVTIYGLDHGDKVKTTTGGEKKKKGKTGVLEGVHLFAKHNYVKGIFAISCLFMVEVTIVDYTMKVLARDHFAAEHPCERGYTCWDPVLDQPIGMSEGATAAFTSFMGFFGQATNILSFVLSLFGTSAVLRKLGLRTALLLFPSLCLIVIIMVRFHPTLYTVFLAMIILKANSYALNNPTKELLYQPTSPAVKYKAKSWIDIFGARGSKALGSVVTNAFSDSATNLIQNGSLVGMAVASFLIWNARFMGRKFEEYTESGFIVGEEENDDDDVIEKDASVEMAAEQNESNDTSCAIQDDDEVGSVEEGQSDKETDVV